MREGADIVEQNEKTESRISLALKSDSRKRRSRSEREARLSRLARAREQIDAFSLFVDAQA